MSHRPLTNTSSLKITAAYCTVLFSWRGNILIGGDLALVYFLRYLKVPKREIFHRSDFPNFHTIKSLRMGDFGVKIKKCLKNI